MSFRIEAVEGAILPIRRHSAPYSIHSIAVLVGGAVLVWGLYRLQMTPFFDSSLLLIAFGLCMAAGAAILRAQQQLLPTGFELDNRKGRLRLLENEGNGCELGYAAIQATGLRYAGRKLFYISLQREGGARLDLLSASFKKRAAQLADRINAHMAGAGRRSQHRPRLSQNVVSTRIDGHLRFIWYDRQSRQLYLLIGFLVCGIALAGLVLLRELHVVADWQVYILWLPGLYLLYACLQIWRDYSLAHFIEIGPRLLLSGRLNRRAGSELQIQQSIARNEIFNIVYNLDLNTAMPVLLLLSEVQAQKISAPVKKGREFKPDPGSLFTRIRRVRLPGLNCSTALAIEAALQKESGR